MSLFSHLIQALFLPDVAHALSIPCPACVGTDLGVYLTGVPAILRDAFAGLLILMIVIYGGKMIFMSNSESTMTEAKSAIVYGIIAGCVVALAEGIAAVTSPTGGAANANTGVLASGVANIAKYFNHIAFAAVVVNTAVQAFRMAASNGNQEQISRATKRIVYGFIGGVIAVIADQIVELFKSGNASPIVSQIQGMVDALTTVLMVGAPIAIGVAGLMLIVSVDESLKEKAKTVIKVTLITVAIFLAADVLLGIAQNPS